MNKRRRTGWGMAGILFTLVELLIVVAIISLLAMMLLPMLRQALINARRVACMNNMKQMMALEVVYADDFGGRLPHGMGATYDFSDNSYSWGELELLVATQYVKRGNVKGLYYCPNDSATKRPSNPSNLWYVSHSYGGRGYVPVASASVVLRPTRYADAAAKGLHGVRHSPPSATAAAFSKSVWSLTQGCNVGYYEGGVKFFHDPQGVIYVFDLRYHEFFWSQYWDVRIFGDAFDLVRDPADKDIQARYNKYYADHVYGTCSSALMDPALNHKNDAVWPPY